jgi:hypothetical protein
MPKIVKPFGATCFRCKSKFSIKYNPGRKEYSKKNEWNYWTNGTIKSDKEEEKEIQYICDPCLKDMYTFHKWEFWSQVKNERKRALLRSYIYLGMLNKDTKKP